MVQWFQCCVGLCNLESVLCSVTNLCVTLAVPESLFDSVPHMPNEDHILPCCTGYRRVHTLTIGRGSDTLAMGPDK